LTPTSNIGGLLTLIFRSKPDVHPTQQDDKFMSAVGPALSTFIELPTFHAPICIFTSSTDAASDGRGEAAAKVNQHRDICAT
jgi:hypothetical protein